MSKKDGQITERLGAILRELREEKGLTREELAERSETGLRHVAAIELGEKNPSVEISQSDPELEALVHALATCSPKQKRLVAAFVEMLLNQSDLI